VTRRFDDDEDRLRSRVRALRRGACPVPDLSFQEVRHLDIGRLPVAGCRLPVACCLLLSAADGPRRNAVHRDQSTQWDPDIAHRRPPAAGRLFLSAAARSAQASKKARTDRDRDPAFPVSGFPFPVSRRLFLRKRLTG
jgi:hypothetical protein